MYDIAFLKRGLIRVQLLEKLENPKISTELAKEFKKSRSSISRTLINLEKKGFVKCLNPKDDKFRYYQITNKGKEVLKKFKGIN